MDDSGRGEFLRFLRKPVNFRPILFCALSFGVGIFFFGRFAAKGALAAVFAFVAVLAAICVALPFCIGRRRKVYLITSAFCLAFVALGLLAADIAFKKYLGGRFETDGYFISGEVESVYENDGKYFATLKNCKYNGKSGGKFYFRYAPPELEKYDIVEVVCNAAPADVFKGSGLSSNVIYGRAMISAGVNYYRVVGKSDKFYAGFAGFTDRILSEGFDREEYAVARALLRGDTDEMGEAIDFYRLSGIAHVFAVSGMHVGLVFAAFTMIFKPIRIRKIYKSLAISCLLFVYAYLCGMTASSVRAAVMCSVAALVGSVGEKKDRVNAIAFAFVVVLVLNPFDLFRVGFVLSFAVSFAIIVFSRQISDKLSFMPTFLRDSLSVMISASSVSVPLCVIYFGAFPLASVISNLIVVPLVSVSFYTLWLGLAISAILPINRLIAFFVPGNLLHLSTGLCKVFANFPLSISDFPTIFAVVYFVALLSVAETVNTGKRLRFASCGYVVLSLVLLSCLSFVL